MTSRTNLTRDIIPELDSYINHNFLHSVQELGFLCSNSNSINELIGKLVDMLRDRNLKVVNWARGRSLFLYASSRERPGLKTFLSYNTCFIPLRNKFSEWSSAIFGLNERNGLLYAPGIADNRATLVARLGALDAWLAVTGELPVNIKFLIEIRSEDETGSVIELVNQKAEILKADLCLWDYGENTPEGLPVLSLGQKGCLTVELSTYSLAHPGDSSLAGILPNGAWRLVWALSAIKDNNEDILISGFDRDVRVPTYEDSSFLAQIAPQYPALLNNRLEKFGLSEYLLGLNGIPLLITEFFTPTANIAGLSGGQTHDNKSLSLIDNARALIDFKLVPDQDPDIIFDLLEKHLNYKGYSDIRVRRVGISEKPARTVSSHPYVKLAIDSFYEGTGKIPLVVPLGRTMSPLAAFKKALGDIPVFSTGTGYYDSKCHTPDENIRKKDLFNHIKFVAVLMGMLENFSREESLSISNDPAIASLEPTLPLSFIDQLDDFARSEEQK